MPSMSSSVIGRMSRSDAVRESTGGSRMRFADVNEEPAAEGGLFVRRGRVSGGRCGGAASPDGEQGHAESDERNPSEDDEPDREIGEDLEHRGERGDRPADGLSRVPDLAGLCGCHGIEWSDREDDRRELRTRLDRVDLTGQLL